MRFDPIERYGKIPLIFFCFKIELHFLLKTISEKSYGIESVKQQALRFSFALGLSLY